MKALPSQDQARFASGLKGVSDQVSQLAALSNTALKKLQTGELGAALAKQPGCSGSAGSAGTAAPAPTDARSASASVPSHSAAPRAGASHAGSSRSAAPASSPS
ncbi:hypothetical protein ACFQZC_20920 [Streptacidiphilus monticola]